MLGGGGGGSIAGISTTGTSFFNILESVEILMQMVIL